MNKLNDAPQSDERIAKRATASNSRSERADRRTTENRETSDQLRLEERHAMLRDVNTLLPVPPEMPGYHHCWLTTTNNKDPLEQRFRLGYELVKPSEVPGFCLSSQKSGEATSDRIMVNEMVLAKIDFHLWESDMKHLHHDLPLEQLNALKNKVQIGEDGRGRKVGYTGGEFSGGVSDGYAQLGKVSSPTFAGVG
jgi:hypothetical protein